MKQILIFAFILMVTSCYCQNECCIVDPVRSYIVIAGQSNATGSGNNFQGDTQAYQGTQDSVFIFNLVTNQFELLTTGVNNYGYTFANGGFGIESKLGQDLRDIRGKETYIVKLSLNGSSINSNAALDWDVTSQNELADSLEVAIQQAEAEIVAMGFVPKMEAFIWIQGEVNSNSATPPTYYESNWRLLKNKVVSDKIPAPLVIDYLMPATLPYPYGGVVNEAKLQVASESYFYHTINSDGFTYKPDLVHLTTTGVFQLSDSVLDILEN